jgi:DNA-binding NarL/FixJ family response regulator
MIAATALFDAGQGERASAIVDEIPDHALTGVQVLERFAFELDVDADLARHRHAARRARLHRLAADACSSTSPFVEAALQWNELSRIAGLDDNGRLSSQLARTLHALTACEAVSNRTAVLRARLLSNIAIVLLEAGDSTQARDATGAAARIVASRDDIPLSLRAIVHAHSAYVYAAAPETLIRSTAERERALLLGRMNSLPRAIWLGLYLRIPDAIWRGENALALHDADELRTHVAFGDSGTWRDIAATRLSNAYSALGRFDDADVALADPRSASSALGFALQTCAVAHRRGRYAQVLAQTARIRAQWPNLSQRYHANNLLYSADAASRVGDMRRAKSDLDVAIAITDSQPPALYIAQRIYALAHRLTGQRRYRDAASDLQHAVEAVAELPSPGKRGLTKRQREVAALAAAGASNREIAARLGLSTRTVGNHLAAAFAELGIRARWQLPKDFTHPPPRVL